MEERIEKKEGFFISLFFLRRDERGIVRMEKIKIESDKSPQI